jgi:predicted TIM-barrel fold metal-dependent hydrolase
VKRFLVFAIMAMATLAEGASSISSITPVADHHAHLRSPASAKLANDPLLPAIELPEDLERLLREREKGWNDKAALARLFTEDSIVLDTHEPRWIRGRDKVTEYLAGTFSKPHRVTPVAYAVKGSTAYIAGYFTRPLEDGSIRYFGHVLLSLQKGADGAWRIAAETPTFPGPRVGTPILAEQLIEQLDDAGIQRATVLSVAYWFGNPDTPSQDEYAKVREENDWTAQQAARFPDRLIAFCGFNPLKDYALQEIERCAKLPHVKGLKLHFGNSWVDVHNPEHVEKVRRVFAAANEHRLAIAAHLWTDPEYGREEAEIFLNQILPAAPDIPVQIAHLAGGGGGPGYTDKALEVFANAIVANDPRTKNLYFDIATVADGQSKEALQNLAERMRQVGLNRILYGTDSAPPAARQSWLTFRTTVPLTDEEFKTIAGNVAPYFR